MKTLTFRIHPITLGLAILIGLPTIAIAAGTILTPPVTVTGSQSGALLTATNQGSGGQAIALMGKSPLGRGVVGETSFNSTSTKDREGGVVGIDSSTSGAFNAGVRGNSRVGSGVQGVSIASNGVDGQTSSATGAFGVLGEDLDRSFNGNAGVVGRSTLGAGVEGISKSGTGVFASSSNGTALEVVGIASIQGGGLGITDGGLGITGGTTFHDVGIEVLGGLPIVAKDSDSCSSKPDCGSTAVEAVDGTAQGIGLDAESDTSTAIFAHSLGGGNPTVLIDSQSAADAIYVLGPDGGRLMSLDGLGNMTISGTLTSGPLVATAHASTGETAISYVPRTAAPILEDFGEAQLVSGKSYVPLDQRFAAIVDKEHPYLVFVTPLGDTNGLFVQSKTSSGFEVVESHGGRSAVTFDYRIVAKPFDTNAARLPRYVKPRAQGQGVQQTVQRIRSQILTRTHS